MLNKKSKSDNVNPVLFAGNIGLEFSSGIIVGVAIGWILDKIFNTAPIFIIILLFFGFVAGIINVYRYVKKNL
ncbi:AtpZ/AtpI family protein [Rickettsiales bacterium LUAb2]